MGDAFANMAAWSNNWVWGMPLIVLTVLTHCAGLILIHQNVVLRIEATSSRRRPVALIAEIVASAVLLLTILHAIEAGVWAAAYVALDARPDFASAMLYSLSAMTAYGHVRSDDRVPVLGPPEQLSDQREGKRAKGGGDASSQRPIVTGGVGRDRRVSTAVREFR